VRHLVRVSMEIFNKSKGWTLGVEKRDFYCFTSGIIHVLLGCLVTLTCCLGSLISSSRKSSVFCPFGGV
jgi:hypothetical protein